MNWKNPKEILPKEGDIVWVIIQHNKEHNPRSCELHCGQVEYGSDGSCRVQTNDFTGSGSWAVYLKINEDEYFIEKGLAWIDSKDFILPSWIPHDKHWG